MHVVFDLTERAAYIITFVTGVAFWLVILMLVALVLVTNRLLDEVLDGDTSEDEDE